MAENRLEANKHLEHPTLQFKVGQPVKVLIDDKYEYFYVLEDNRPYNHCTYTYTLIKPNATPELCPHSGDIGTTVYCHYPKDIEPVSQGELILFFKKFEDVLVRCDMFLKGTPYLK